MIIVNSGRTLGSGDVEPRHTIEKVCAHCGYDLTEKEITADTCADCGQPLNLKENVAIVVASVPMTGATFGG